MQHFKILGWLWLVFGVICSLVAVWALCTPADEPAQVVIASSRAWWQELIGDSLECGFLVASAVFGFALLRRWRRAHLAVGILGAVLLAASVWVIPRPWFPPTTLVIKIAWLSPLLSLSLYSLIAVFLCKYEQRVA